jgi:hypothetical protein
MGEKKGRSRGVQEKRNAAVPQTAAVTAEKRNRAQTDVEPEVLEFLREHFLMTKLDATNTEILRVAVAFLHAEILDHPLSDILRRIQDTREKRDAVFLASGPGKPKKKPKFGIKTGNQ